MTLVSANLKYLSLSLWKGASFSAVYCMWTKNENADQLKPANSMLPVKWFLETKLNILDEFLKNIKTMKRHFVITF